MLYHHFVQVRFDNETADVAEQKKYYDFMNRYTATGLAMNNGKSEFIFNSDRKLDKKQISKELGGLAVLALNISEIKAA